MPNSGRHCPFLNREDARCAECHTVNHMAHAFGYCFDRYQACPMYLELLVERRLKRSSANLKTAHGTHGHDLEVTTYLDDVAQDRVALPVLAGR